MYQNNSFYISEQEQSNGFYPAVTSVYKILADQSYSHICDDDEKLCYSQNTVAFIRCTGGQGIITLNSRKIELSENEYVFLKFQDIVQYKSNSNMWGYRWVNFIAKNISSEFELNKIYNIPFSENEDKAFNKLLASGQAELKNRDYINSLFLSYFYSITVENQLDENSLFSDSSTSLIDEMCSYIHQKQYFKISIDEMAAFFKISPRRLHQIFTDKLDISPKKYILKKKMEEGYRLLVQTSMPINKIAYMLCFSSPYHFTNEFKRTFGQSPSEVRKMEQKYDNRKQ